MRYRTGEIKLMKESRTKVEIMAEIAVKEISEYLYNKMIEKWEFASYGSYFDSYVVFTRELKRMVREIKAGEKALGATEGLTRLEAMCLALIWRRPLCDTIPRVASQLREDRGAVWRAVQGLKKKGLLELNEWDLQDEMQNKDADCVQGAGNEKGEMRAQNGGKASDVDVDEEDGRKKYKVKLEVSERGKEVGDRLVEVMSEGSKRGWEMFSSIEKNSFFRVLGGGWEVVWCENNAEECRRKMRRQVESQGKQVLAEKEGLGKEVCVKEVCEREGKGKVRKLGEGTVLAFLKMKMDCQRQRGCELCDGCEERGECDVFEFFRGIGEGGVRRKEFE